MTGEFSEGAFFKRIAMMKLRGKKGSARLPIGELVSQGEITVIYGDRRMTVQGCKKILAYAPSEIRLQLKNRVLCVRGEGLACSSFSGGCTTLEGLILSVHYEKSNERGEKK